MKKQSKRKERQRLKRWTVIYSAINTAKEKPAIAYIKSGEEILWQGKATIIEQ